MVCLMYGLTYIDRINVNTAGPSLQRDLHLSTVQLGWVFSAFGWAYLALQVWGGWLSDRFGARLTLTVCGVIWAGSTMLIGLVGSFTALIVCRVIVGLGEGATFPQRPARWRIGFRGKARLCPGHYAFVCTTGKFLYSPLVAFLIGMGSWRLSFMVLGGVSLYGLWSGGSISVIIRPPIAASRRKSWRDPRLRRKKDRTKDPFRGAR